MRIIVPFLVVVLSFAGCSPQGPRSTVAQEVGMDIEARLTQLGIQLRQAPAPTANYVRAVTTGNLVFLAGHGPDRPEGGQVIGKVGPTGLTLEQAQEAARLTGLSLISSLKDEIGDLNRVTRIVKVQGMVNAEPAFTQHSQVINGFSDLMVEIFGERGKHARASVGMSSLPNDIAVEIDMVVEIRD
jgi:enamine deaminase RidA (YjgF/YER057c/UK114 family)